MTYIIYCYRETGSSLANPAAATTTTLHSFSLFSRPIRSLPEECNIILSLKSFDLHSTSHFKILHAHFRGLSRSRDRLTSSSSSTRSRIKSLFIARFLEYLYNVEKNDDQNRKRSHYVGLLQCARTEYSIIMQPTEFADMIAHFLKVSYIHIYLFYAFAPLCKHERNTIVSPLKYYCELSHYSCIYLPTYRFTMMFAFAPTH